MGDPDEVMRRIVASLGESIVIAEVEMPEQLMDAIDRVAASAGCSVNTAIVYALSVGIQKIAEDSAVAAMPWSAPDGEA